MRMLGNFFNSFYYGKAGKSDFNPENLPEKRTQLFFDMLRVRWSGLVRLNLLYVLVWLPTLLWTLLNLLAANNILTLASAEEITGIEMSAQLLGLLRSWLLILFPCVAITGPVTAGVSIVTRNWARDQHSFMLSDIKDAIKDNWKQALAISTITGFFPLIVYTSYVVYGNLSSESSMIFIVPQMMVVFIGLFWLLALQVLYTLMVTYKLSFKNLLRNALLLSIGKLPLSVGIRLISLIIPGVSVAIMLFLPDISVYALLVFILYLLLFGFAFNRFLYASYANAVCEKYINTKIDGAPVGMGLRQVTDDDFEIDPTVPQPPGVLSNNENLNA